MPLSARRLRRRAVRVEAVGLPRRLLSAGLDALLPTAGLFVMMRTGGIRLEMFRPPPDLFALDHLLLTLYRQPGAALRAPITWMLLWTAFSLVFLGTVRTTPGKWLTGLQLRQADGGAPSGPRQLARIIASWLVPLSLGLAFFWIVVSPERRGWHDTVSGTWVVRPAPVRPGRP